ncbi:S8 family serine peptidase [Bdellovibrio sp. HCB288]|uniref:S8 family serine peptidase n=1 Tax=Bdellovibrio sp. HCB288 TaxID=3394355 RepID=UPI0039B5DD5E
MATVLRTKKILSALLLVFSSVTLSVLLVNCNGGGFELASTCFNDGGDPLFPYAWHLANCGQQGVSRNGGTSGVDLNLRATWSAGILGNGVKVRVSDDGLQHTHEDLSPNFQTVLLRSRDYTTGSPYDFATAPPNDCPNADPSLSEYDDHGTAVAGLIAAAGGNGVGARGVAPKAQLSIANLLSCAVTQSDAIILDQATGTDFDVLNMSWGVDQNSLPEIFDDYETQLHYAVTNYRSNKGAILVKAAGNFFRTECHHTASNPNTTSTCVGNSNLDGDNSNPYQILVAALNAQGYASSYSSPGANIWVSGFGGEFGYTNPAMVTTDRTSCSDGYSFTGASNTVSFENGTSPNNNCNYTATFNGTSSAAPTVSGVAALLLEANPNLTWRDVKYILAKTAVPMDYVTTGSIRHPLGTSVPSGYAWELPWRTNGAGFKFHNWYGFGKVDVDAAVSMARSYSTSLGTYFESPWLSFMGLNSDIPAGSIAGATDTRSITVGTDQDVKIESVQIRLQVTHADLSKVAIELTSPSGMRSIIVNMHNSLTTVANYNNQVFLTNAFYQERSSGVWNIKLVNASGTGTLTSWGIKFTGVK